jgi:Uma2 family endonuclease
MANVLTPASTAETIADLLERLGDIPADRVRLRPWPGTATVRDVLTIRRRERRRYELVDGTLVEKAMGVRESFFAWVLGVQIGNYLTGQDLGICLGADGMLRIATGLVRIPDLSFISWDRVPNREVPRAPIPRLAPDLAVEVLSEGNTKRELGRKLREYFDAGVLLVWLIDPRTRTARVHTAPDRSILLHEDQALDGGAVLPGFALPLRDLFDRAERRPGP